MPTSDPPGTSPSATRRIGAITDARHGTHHMRAIGKAGARSTNTRHGIAFFQGIVQRKAWHGRRPVASLVVDLAAGRVDALLAA